VPVEETVKGNNNW